MKKTTIVGIAALVLSAHSYAQTITIPPSTPFTVVTGAAGETSRMIINVPGTHCSSSVLNQVHILNYDYTNSLTRMSLDFQGAWIAARSAGKSVTVTTTPNGVLGCRVTSISYN